ncbi:hypothetical protein VINI7043_09257, partial [Vibrio nigripulchritudo ATCC 27043]
LYSQTNQVNGLCKSALIRFKQTIHKLVTKLTFVLKKVLKQYNVQSMGNFLAF